jgi:transposase InsO family protein
MSARAEEKAEIVQLCKAESRWRTIHAQRRRAGAPHVPADLAMHHVLQRNSWIPSRRSRRAKPAWRRFLRYAPNDLWQIDGTQVALADGSAVWRSTSSMTTPASL